MAQPQKPLIEINLRVVVPLNKDGKVEITSMSKVPIEPSFTTQLLASNKSLLADILVNVYWNRPVSKETINALKGPINVVLKMHINENENLRIQLTKGAKLNITDADLNPPRKK